MTHDLILHQYAGSPFAEKVRLVLGCKRLAWRAVEIPRVMPKPDVVALTGGYRRTPLLQIGADIYCDSALICKVLDRLQPEPPLYPRELPLAESFAAWADSSLFWTVMPVAFQPAGAAQIFADAGPEDLKAFATDRAAMTTGMPRLTRTDATVQFGTYLTRCERQLADGRRFLFGDALSIADFSVAHCLWFVHRLPALRHLLAPYPALLAWLEQVLAFGHGARSAFTSGEAIAVAHDAEPVPCAFDDAAAFGLRRDEPVTVAALDYGTDPVAGTLVGLTADEVAVQRDDARAGTVVVHFPRIGFQIRKQEGSR
jgi:glutathione S-transferase